jgi:DNA uptake protein ComE-like DNA-binding protein
MMKAMRTVVHAAVVLMLFATGASAQGANASVINPNTATEKELTSLPHMTPALAKNLIAGRPYRSMVAVNTVVAAALTEAQRKELYVRLFVPINLNTATREEIMLVPGMGNRMAHEFEEYRPYRNIEQFRKEIGKYVDKAEVARFEKYVTLQ